MHHRRFVVSGRVQGVGFRVYVQNLANDLGLTGAVWNTRSGTVEVQAGSDSELVMDDFARKLWDGPGHVSNVAETPLADGPEAIRFEIRPTV